MNAPVPFSTSTIIAAVGALYFLVVLAIGAWATRRTRTAGDFFVAGQGIGVWALAIAAMAATLSGFIFIGGPGLMYRVGFGALFIVLSATITNSMTAWALAKRMRLLGEARGLVTVPDAIGARYDSRAAQGIAAVALLIAVIGYMATNVLALGLVIQSIFATSFTASIWIGALVTLAYSASGGILAGIYTDLFQGALMAIASLLVFGFALQAGGGLPAMSGTLLAADPTFVGPWGKMTPLAAISLFFVFGLGALGQPHVVHKFYMLKDPRRLQWYPLLMTAALVVTLLLFFSVGLVSRVLVVRGEMPPLASPDAATPTFLLRHTPAVLGALVFSGVAAAIMSTVNSFMNIGAAALTRDIPKALGFRVDDELRWGRIWTVAISLAAALLAQLSGTLVAFLGIFGWGLFASTFVPALAIGLNWRGATRAGAIASMATGVAITLGLETLAWFRLFTFPAGVTATAVALVTALLVFFVVSWMTSGGAGEEIPADVQVVMDT